MPWSAGEISLANRSRSLAGIVKRSRSSASLCSRTGAGRASSHEPELRVPRIAAVGRLGADEAMPVAPEEQHRLEAIDRVVADPEHGLDERPAVVMHG